MGVRGQLWRWPLAAVPMIVAVLLIGAISAAGAGLLTTASRAFTPVRPPVPPLSVAGDSAVGAVTVTASPSALPSPSTAIPSPAPVSIVRPTAASPKPPSLKAPIPGAAGTAATKEIPVDNSEPHQPVPGPASLPIGWSPPPVPTGILSCSLVSQTVVTIGGGPGNGALAFPPGDGFVGACVVSASGPALPSSVGIQGPGIYSHPQIVCWASSAAGALAAYEAADRPKCLAGVTVDSDGASATAWFVGEPDAQAFPSPGGGPLVFVNTPGTYTMTFTSNAPGQTGTSLTYVVLPDGTIAGLSPAT